jgi:hypothetical protein
MRTYVIIDASEVSSVDFNQVLNRNSDYVSYSLDGSKAYVKFEGDTPSFLIGKPQYTREEMLNILSGPEWTDPDVNP